MTSAARSVPDRHLHHRDEGTAADGAVGGDAGAGASHADLRLQQVHQRLQDAVQNLTSGPGWQQMLRTAAALPTYSPHNVLLITQQCPQAQAVAGFHTWKALGRSVRKGEKGLAILAPVVRRATGKDQSTTSPTDRPAARSPAQASGPVAPDPGKDTAGRSRRVVGFRVAHVFDISQTDGPQLPDPTPVLLNGQAPPGLLDGLSAQVREQDFQLIRHDFTIPHPGQGSPNGVTDYFARTVIVRPDLTPAQTVKTLAHELGHVLLHGPGQRHDGLTREQAEVEAESVAYVVTAAHSLDSSDYTIPCVAGWSAGNAELVARTAERVLSTAKDILARTPPPPTLQLGTTTRDRLRGRGTAATLEPSSTKRTLGADNDAPATPPVRSGPSGRRTTSAPRLGGGLPPSTARSAPPAGQAGSVQQSARQSVDQGRLW
jgi:DNA primase